MSKQLTEIFNNNIGHRTVRLGQKISDYLGNPGLYEFGCLFVTEKNGILRGIVTDGDIRRALQKKIDISQVSVNEIMTDKVVRINEHKSVLEAYRLMAERSINHLPVVNSKELLMGFVSFHELAAYLSPEHLFIELSEQSSRSENEQRHIYRYKFASNFIRPKDKVLDAACGSGYGTAILSENGANVLGIDLNDKVIEFAKLHNSQNSVNFIVEDIAALDFPDASFDAIVTIETLEHLPHSTCKEYLCNIASWIKPKGIFVASSPMLRYRDGKPYVTSPYHVNEMPKDELLAMFEACLPGFVFQLYYQDETSFLPLLDEHTGFCILVARKKS